ncbi:hypothetical protein [Tropicibacter oceani]|uniref:Uncharacterized protein n=1 Tax=Tropicibacter oceani TaxID=3058420 RepID=A0ABY8QI52_9RHOB|nr:hypothetical protein [Tropicibacter oceani]WGW03648.1 hypothetical protein QF118_17280 [Tropicibacter oceani]
MKKKFGSWLFWSKPIPVHSIGPTNPHAFDAFADRLDELKAKARHELEQLSDLELRELRVGQAPEFADLRSWFSSLLGDEIKSLERNQPVWLAMGFGHPDVAADYDYWGKLSRYSVYEATMLSLGVEPSKFPEHQAHSAASQEEPTKMNPQMFHLGRQMRLFQGHFPVGPGGYMPVSPVWLKKLIDEIDLQVPEAFYSQLEKRTLAIRLPDDRPSQSLSMQERQSLLRLIAAMACEQYQFDPKATRTTAISSICEDLDRVGLSMDNKTVRKWVREAAELVPADYWKQ